jgi:hypothetical protein
VLKIDYFNPFYLIKLLIKRKPPVPLRGIRGFSVFLTTKSQAKPQEEIYLEPIEELEGYGLRGGVR